MPHTIFASESGFALLISLADNMPPRSHVICLVDCSIAHCHQNSIYIRQIKKAYVPGDGMKRNPERDNFAVCPTRSI